MMAKKSEFAQKLLDDLKMRKEKIAAGTGHTYGHSYSSIVARDAHGQSIKSQRSTRVTGASKTGSSKTNGTHRRSSSCSGSFELPHSSNQLVPFGQGHDAKETGDVSAAIDFVFQNGHKLMMDSSMSISFLQQITHGPVIDFQNTDMKISTYPIKENLKLSNILAASSEKYSELFRGSKNLLESLRMLVGLEEAANSMTTQKKSRIRLLEGYEEDNDHNQKQIDKPRFSFDKKQAESTSSSIRQRSAYLTNESMVGSASPRLNLKSEKKCLPNIIAKLMGLEELLPSESKKEMCKVKHSATPITKKTFLQADRVPPLFFGASYVTPEKKRQSSDNLSSQSGINKLQKDMENGRKKTPDGGSTFNMQHKRFNRATQHQMIQKQSHERRRKFAKAKNSPHQEKTNILPGNETCKETKMEITHYQHTAQIGFGFSKRKLFGQPEMNDQKRKVDRNRIQQKSGIHAIHKKVHKYRESQQHDHRKSGPPPTEVRLVVKEDYDDHTITSKDQGVGAGLKTSKAPPVKEDNYIQVKTSLKKVPKSKVHKSNSFKMVDQVMQTNQDSPHWPVEQQGTLLEETEFQHDDRTKIVTGDNTQPLQTNTQPPWNEVENHSAFQTLYLTDIVTSNEKAPLSRTENTREPGGCIVHSKETGWVGRISSDIPDRLDKLNEEGTILKCMLVQSPHFINTAEALFKVNIPANIILQADNQECEDTEHKHILEASYEIMERKARKQELKVNPFIKNNCTSLREVQSLNDLVKQLNKDLEMLKCYGGVWGHDTGAYLLQMVERDMHCTYPDINCMWEYGWNEWCFALAEKNETIEEVENSIVDELLDVILHDMLS